MQARLMVGIIALMLSSGADAKKKKAPPPPPPPPPVVVVIPPRPVPPLNASKLLISPPLGLDGMHRTVNTGISTAQTIWNFRAAYNVAALNCLRPEHAEILTGYKKFLKINARALALANRSVDREFRATNGAAFIRPREAYMTRVYNFYAIPPTVPQFCDAALAMSRESLAVTPKELGSFAALQLPRIDGVFEQFFRAYDQWRTDAALWDARYAPTPAAPALPPAFATSQPAAPATASPGTIATPAPGTTAAPAPGTMVSPAPTPGSTMGPTLPGI